MLRCELFNQFFHDVKELRRGLNAPIDDPYLIGMSADVKTPPTLGCDFNRWSPVLRDWPRTFLSRAWNYHSFEQY